MQEDTNAAPAGDSAQISALSLDDAVALFDAEDRKQDEAKAEPASKEAEPEGEAETVEETETAPTDEVETPPEPETDEGEPEAEPEADEFVHGNAKTTLRDGTVVAVADLKKAFGELQELKRQSPEIQASRAEIEKAKAEVQQQTKFIEEALPYLHQIANSAVPPRPDDALWDADPIEALQQQRRHDAGREALERVKAVQQQTVAQQEKAVSAELERVRAEHESKLVAARPELADPQKRSAFEDQFLKVAQSLGFTKEEAGTAYDHRLKAGIVTLAEKARKYDAIQANKPKVADKAKDAVPVQAPGRRPAPSERRAAEVDELDKRLSRTGSLEDAVALVGKLGLGR